VQGGTGGTTTGVYYPATNTVAFATNGAERMRLDASGNLVLGTTSSLSSQAGRTDLTVNGSSSAIVSLGIGGTRQGYFYAPSTGISLTSETGLLNLQTTTAQPITFATNSTTALTIGSNQAITVANTGNGITYSSSGGSGLRIYGAGGTHQWDFYLNGANIRLGDNTGGGAFQLDSNLNFGSSNGGIVFNNSNAATNSTLNDYETGSFTPTIANAGSPSYSTQYGIYTKVGNLVFVTGKISVTGATLLTNAITVGGLPFSGISTSDSGQRSSSMVYGDWSGMGTYSTTGRFRINGSTIVGVRDSGGGSAYWYYSDLGSTTFGFNFCLCYIANF
jgi:hypothetical protein